VVISGLQAGVSNTAAAWAPVAAAFKMDEASFAQRVLAALPLIVRQKLDKATADQIVQQLQASRIEARSLPDDAQVAHFKRNNIIRGPLPLSGLGEFLKHNEKYRIVGSTEWKDWFEPLPTFELPSMERSTHAPSQPTAFANLPLPEPVSSKSASSAVFQSTQGEKMLAKSQSSKQKMIGRIVVIVAVVFTPFFVYFLNSVFNDDSNSTVAPSASEATTTRAEPPAAIESTAEVIPYVTGVWTYTDDANANGGLWERYTFTSDGHFTNQLAMPSANNWGSVNEAGHIEPTTNKFADNGKRWYGFTLFVDDNDSGFHGEQSVVFIIRSDGALIEKRNGDDPSIEFMHHDANPFSK
jgi:hypothetical protein